MANKMDIGSLVTDLIVNDDKFKADLRSAASSVNSFSAKTNRYLAKAERQWTSLRKSVLNFRSGMVLAAGATGLGYLIKRNIDAADTIGKTADRIGISTDKLQEYRFMAERSGVETGKLDGALEAFTKRIGELKVGTGAMLTYLKKYDEELLNQLVATNTTGEALDIYINRMAGIENATDKAAFSSAAFGRSAGVGMTNVVKGGMKSVEELRATFERLGLAIDEHLIRGSATANDRLTDLSTVIKTQMTSAVISAAPSIAEIAEDMTSWVAQNQEFLRQDIPTYLGNIAQSLKLVSSAAGGAVGSVAFAAEWWAGLLYGPDTVMGRLKEQREDLQKELNKFQSATTGSDFTDKALAWVPGYITKEEAREGAKRLTANIALIDKTISDLQNRQQYAELNKIKDSWMLSQPDFSSFTPKAANIKTIQPKVTGLTEADKLAFISKANRNADIERLAAAADRIRQENQLNIEGWEARISLESDTIKDIQTLWNEHFQTEEQRLSDWYDVQREYIEKSIQDEEAKQKAIEQLTEVYYEKQKTEVKSLSNELENAMSGWASSWSSTLNEMVWGADTSFNDILKSYSKMVTQMMLQKYTIEPLFNTLTGGSSGNGLISKAAGAITGMFSGGFTPNFDNPVQFMAGGGTINEHIKGIGESGQLYEFGERGPEKVSPMNNLAQVDKESVTPELRVRNINVLDPSIVGDYLNVNRR